MKITIIDKIWHFGIALVLQLSGAVLPFELIISTALIVGLAVGYEFCQWELNIRKLNWTFVIDSILDLLAAVLGVGVVYGIYLILGNMV